MLSSLSKRMLLNLALLALVLALGGVAWWWQARPPSRTDYLLPFTVADVQTLVIDRQPQQTGQNVLQFRRLGEQWYMEKPFHFPAHAVRLRQLLTLLDEPVQAEYDAQTMALTDYGLNPPLVSLQINGEVVLLGQSNPVSGDRYVLQGGKVKLVNETVFANLQSDALELLSLKLIPTGAQIKRIEFADNVNATPAQLSAWQAAEAIRMEPLPPDHAATPSVSLGIELVDQQRLDYQLRQLADDAYVLDRVAVGLRYWLTPAQREILFPVAMTNHR